MCALMNERPRIIKRSTSQGSTHQGNFSFDKSWIRIPEKNSYIADYRERAWNAYNKLSIPQINEEAWRRTDLRELSKLASQFKIENIDDLNNEIPDSFQNSVFGEKAENQLIISGGKITKSVDPTLLKSGLVFTDLIDAEQKHPELVEKAPKNTIILTLACGKFRFFDKDLGTIDEIPRLLDIGQCNDAYSAVKIAQALADAFHVGVNDLPLSMVLSWYEQKAVAILLSLLYLGIKDIRIGPSLPAFITPNILKVLVEKFNIMPIKTADEDLKAIMK